MKGRRLVAAAIITGLARSSVAWAVDTGPEEFVGPFANSLNLQTTCGATGNGTTDDTAAVQTCFNDVNSTTPWLWIPAPSSCYKITSTVTYTWLYGIAYGASPSTTPFCWGGSSGGTMFRANGTAYSVFGRVTLNGANGASPAGILEDQNWDGSTGNFDTGNEYPDIVFENAGYGIRCGASGRGCAETVPIRDTFSALTTAGIAMGNQNALDMFVWYSQFLNDYDGMQNTLNSGGFHAFESYFSGSTDSDLKFANTTGFDFRWNYSIGSNQFLNSGYNGNPCTINLQGNIILDYTDGNNVIYTSCYGPLTMVDNVIRTLSPNHYQPVYPTLSGASVFSVGNTFTIANPYNMSSGGTLVTFGDIVVPRSAINPTAPTLPPVPPSNTRVITEVTAGSSSSTIQTDITNACNSGDERPVVHFQAGLYSNISVTIPANCDIQPIGDGHYSHLQGTGSTPVITLTGPNFSTPRDMWVDGNGGVGITMSGVDQLGARLFMEGVSPSNNTVNVAFNGLQYLNVEAHDFFDGAAGSISVNITGPTGQWLGSQFSVFAGATSNNAISYEVSNGGHLIVRDQWNDTGNGSASQRLNLTGSGGSVTFFGGQNFVSPGSGTAPSFLVNNFGGNFALVGSALTGNDIVLSGAGGPSNDLIATQALEGGPVISNSAIGNTYAFLENMNGISTYEANSSNYQNQSFLLNVLSQARGSQPTIPGSPSLLSGSTDLRMYHVYVSNSSVGISINP